MRSATKADEAELESVLQHPGTLEQAETAVIPVESGATNLSRYFAATPLFVPKEGRPWNGYAEGEGSGNPVTVIAYGTDIVGAGPRLHVHPYSETFIVLEGRARFFIGNLTFDASAGEMIFGPAGVPHRFVNLGPGRLQTIDVHHSPRWIQTNLES